MKYLGDFLEGSIVRIYFSTNAADGSRVAFGATIEVADIKVYKNGVATARASEAGYTLDETVDSMVGIHCISIDTSDNTDAGFYAAANDYVVILYPDETVDSKAVSAVLGQFSIENRNIKANVTQWLGTAAHAATEAGTPCVEVVRWGGQDVAATGVNGVPKVDITHVNAAAQTATLDTVKADAVEVLTRLPDATAGAVSGLVINDAATAYTTKSIYDAMSKPATAQTITAPVDLAVNLTKINGVAQTATLDTIKAETVLIVADTNELQVDINNTHTWHLAKTGLDANGGHSFGAAKLTIGAAITAAAAGDTIIVWPGTYTELVDVTKALTIIGLGKQKTIITNAHASTPVVSINADDITIKSVSIIATHATTGTGITIQAAKNRYAVLDCYISGSQDGFFISSAGVFPSDGYLADSTMSSNYDAIQIAGAKNLIIERCKFFGLGINTTSRAITSGLCKNVIIKDSTADVVCALTGTSVIAGIDCEGQITLDNILINVAHTGTGAPTTWGLYVSGTGQVIANKVNIKSSAVAGTHYSIYVYEGILNVLNCIYDSTLVEGTVIDRAEEIVADTGELQTNQGNWLTATGFATPTNITAGTITTVGTVNALANGAITAAAIATNAIDADALAADALTEIQASCDAAITANTDINNIDTGVNNLETTCITNAAGTDIAADIIAIKTQTDKITDRLIECDQYIDITNPLQYQLVITKKGDVATEYVRKNIKDINGTAITSINTVIGQLKEPA